MECPLCASRVIEKFYQSEVRDYYQCQNCALIFVAAEEWLDPDLEKELYDFHQNNPEDQSYRKFLGRIAVPLLAKMPPQQSGLDFGCGPGPTLSIMLSEAGHKVALYDLFYHADKQCLASKYDFVTATEVVEHFQAPQKEFKRLFKMIRANGWLAIMTKRYSDQIDFASWHYIRDPTHICFYSCQTFAYLARKYQAEVEFIGNDVVIFNCHG